MRGRSLALSFLLVAGGAAACSDDSGTDAQPYVDALTEELEGDDMTDDQAECMAEQTIDAIGADFLADNDIEPEDLAGSDGPQDLDIEISEEQASGAAEAFVDCDISFAEGLLGADASEEATACVEDNLDEDVIVEALTAEYLGDSEESEEIFGEAFTALQTECAEFLGG